MHWLLTSPKLAAVAPYHILSCRERERSESKETLSEGRLGGRLPWRWGARWPSPLIPVQGVTEVTAQLPNTLWDGAGLCYDGIIIPLLPLARSASLAFLGLLLPGAHPSNPHFNLFPSLPQPIKRIGGIHKG